jgi:Domain of unknown function (DUF5666)
MKKYKVHIVWAIIVVVALIGGWYYGKTTSASSGVAGRLGAYSSSTRAAFAGRGGAAGGGFVSGQILSIGAQSFTVQLANGNSEVVFYSSSTSVVKPTIASVSDLTVGSNVMIGGSTNSDGSVTAQTIQVRPTPANQ